MAKGLAGQIFILAPERMRDKGRVPRLVILDVGVAKQTAVQVSAAILVTVETHLAHPRSRLFSGAEA